MNNEKNKSIYKISIKQIKHLIYLKIVANDLNDAAADSVEDLKRLRYASLDRAYMFEAFGVGTLGLWGTGAVRVLKITGHLSKQRVTRELALVWLNVCIVIQRAWRRFLYSSD